LGYVGNNSKSHLLPLTVPVSVPHLLHSLVSEEVLTVNTWLRHGGCAVLEESNYIDPLGNDLAVDDKVDLGVNLMVGLTAILITLSKLGSASTQSIDSDLSIPGVSRQVKDVTISKGLIACLVVHWTLRPLLLMIKCKGQVCDLHLPGDLWKDSCLIVSGGGCGPLRVERDHQL